MFLHMLCQADLWWSACRHTLLPLVSVSSVEEGSEMQGRGRPVVIKSGPVVLGEVTQGLQRAVSGLLVGLRTTDTGHGASSRPFSSCCAPSLLLQMSKVWNDLKPKLNCLFAGPNSSLTLSRSPQDGVSPH